VHCCHDTVAITHSATMPALHYYGYHQLIIASLLLLAVVMAVVDVVFIIAVVFIFC